MIIDSVKHQLSRDVVDIIVHPLQPDGKVIFYQEVYHTGLSLRFSRRDVEHYVRLSLDKLNDDLKIRLDELGGAKPA